MDVDAAREAFNVQTSALVTIVDRLLQSPLSTAGAAIRSAHSRAATWITTVQGVIRNEDINSRTCSQLDIATTDKAV